MHFIAYIFLVSLLHDANLSRTVFTNGPQNLKYQSWLSFSSNTGGLWEWFPPRTRQQRLLLLHARRPGCGARHIIFNSFFLLVYSWIVNLIPCAIQYWYILKCWPHPLIPLWLRCLSQEEEIRHSLSVHVCRLIACWRRVNVGLIGVGFQSFWLIIIF